MLQNIAIYGWIIIQVLIGYHLVFPLFLYLFSQLKSVNQTYSTPSISSDYGIIVTAYQQTATLKGVVNSLLNLNHTNFMVYVVADNCDITNLHFTDERVMLLKPEQVLSSNTRSHFYAINRFKRPHNRITIIDSDNLVDPEYLNHLDHFFNAGFEAVQGVREAKNIDTTLARLDAARDIYYHFYDGKILFKTGSSATLAGSGMAFTTKLYKDCLENKDVSGAGFDKVLQYAILKQNKRIAFAEHAVVYDEKTTQSDQLVNQRSRWINTWFKYFKFGFTLVFKGITNFSFNQFLFGAVLLRPPLFIFLMLSALCCFISFLVSATAFLFWIIGFACFIAGFAIALLKSNTDKRIYQSLVNIPKFMFYQVIALVHARRANSRSVATTHFHQVELDDIKK